MAVPKLPFKFDLGVIDGVSGPLKRISDKVGSSVFGQGFKRFSAGVGSVMGVVTKTTAAVTGLVTAAGGGMFALARSTAKAGDEIGKLSSRIDVSAQFLQEWQYISERQGVGIEQFNDGIQDFAKNLGELRLRQGSLLGILQGTAPAMVAWLGDGDRGVEASFEGFLDKLRNVEDATTQAAIANAAFGGAGKMMLGLLRTDAAGLEQLRQEAHKYGRMLSTETVANSESFLDMLTDLESSIGKVKDMFGSALMPEFERFGRAVAEYVAGNGPELERWAERTATLVREVGKAFDYVTNGISGLDKLLTVVKPGFESVAGRSAGELAVDVGREVAPEWLRAAQNPTAYFGSKLGERLGRELGLGRQPSARVEVEFRNAPSGMRAHAEAAGMALDVINGFSNGGPR